jgi:hypothetical protein
MIETRRHQCTILAREKVDPQSHCRDRRDRRDHVHAGVFGFHAAFLSIAVLEVEELALPSHFAEQQRVRAASGRGAA